jgi:glycosyltransferase involved in cell wall biosynthesis
MSVLLISPWIKLGGSECLVLRLARLLSARGCRVSVACCFVDSKLIEDQVRGIHFIQPWRWIGALSRRSRAGLVFLGCPALLVTVLRHAGNYELLNPHNFPSLWIAALASRIAGIRVVWHFNEPAPIPKRLAGLEGTAARRARAITVLDERSRSRVSQAVGRDAIVVRAGVDLTFWGSDAGSVASLAGRATEEPTLLSVGKIHPQKNQIMLVDVLHELAGLVPGLRLLITGDGPARRQVEQRVNDLKLRDRVIFTGTVDAATLRALYRSAFLVCFPALDQTWGLTPFEALCQKTVSLVSSQVGAAEVLGPQGIGLVANPDAPSFARAIQLAWEDTDRIDAMGERGFAFVKEVMSWERFGDRMLEVFGPAPADRVSAA